MASRERGEHAVIAAAAPKQHRESAFRRGAGDFEDRQLPGPRRFGFARSPPRHNHNSSSNNSPAIYSPPRTRDTARQSTILPSSSAYSRQERSPPASRTSGRVDIRVSNDVRVLNGSASSAPAPSREAESAPDADRHPVFSQLALVLGYELAKKVTARYPREFDLNRLANLALDIGSSSSGAAPAAEAAASPPAAPAAATTPSRSASTTSQASSTTTTELRRAFYGRPNRSPMDEGRRFGRGSGGPGASRASPLGRARANSPPIDDSFVTAVSAATIAAFSSPSAPTPPPPLMAVDVEAAAAAAEAVTRSAASAAVVTATNEDVASSSFVVEEDLIDWNVEAAPHEVLSAPHHSSVDPAPSHLLD